MLLQHGGNIYRQSVCADFSVNLNPLGTPESVLKAVCDSAHLVVQYPDPAQEALCSSLSRILQIPASQILPGNGGAELIDSYIRTVSPRNALLPEPSFSEYRRALNAQGCAIRSFPLQAADGYRLEKSVLQALTKDLDLVMLCSPNNPTGCMIPPALLHTILEHCRTEHIRVFLDECFIMLSDHPEFAVNASDLAAYPNLFVLRSFTKSFAMPGIRLGYGLSGDADLLAGMQEHVQPWNISIPASAAGIAALGDVSHVEQARPVIRRERAYLQELLQQYGFHVYESSANYLLFKAPEDLYSRLLKKNILIRNCDNYAGLGPGCYRIAVRCHADNLLLAEALHELYSGR